MRLAMAVSVSPAVWPRSSTTRRTPNTSPAASQRACRCDGGMRRSSVPSISKRKSMRPPTRAAIAPGAPVCLHAKRAPRMIAWGYGAAHAGVVCAVARREQTSVLRFEIGDSEAPRGHALMYARLSGSAERIVATYCIVLPISFSLGKYLPPMLAGQLPVDALRDESTGNAMPIPPMFEDVAGGEYLRQLAERRGDDLCDMGTLLIADDNQRLAFAAEGCMEYAELYAAYQQRSPVTAERTQSEESPLDDVDVEDVVASMLPERDRLAEIARLIGQSRYALE